MGHPDTWKVIEAIAAGRTDRAVTDENVTGAMDEYFAKALLSLRDSREAAPAPERDKPKDVIDSLADAHNLIDELEAALKFAKNEAAEGWRRYEEERARWEGVVGKLIAWKEELTPPESKWEASVLDALGTVSEWMDDTPQPARPEAERARENKCARCGDDIDYVVCTKCTDEVRGVLPIDTPQPARPKCETCGGIGQIPCPTFNDAAICDGCEYAGDPVRGCYPCPDCAPPARPVGKCVECGDATVADPFCDDRHGPRCSVNNPQPPRPDGKDGEEDARLPAVRRTVAQMYENLGRSTGDTEDAVARTVLAQVLDVIDEALKGEGITVVRGTVEDVCKDIVYFYIKDGSTNEAFKNGEALLVKLKKP